MPHPTQPLIIANWKSHKNEDEAYQWLKTFEEDVATFRSDLEVVIAPAFPLVPMVSEFLANDQWQKVSLAVQDISSFPAGAYTGAVAGQNLQGFEVKYAVVGHSERRRYFHETHQDVANKVDQALAAKITPIVCVDQDYVEAQASAIEAAVLTKCVVAYEPLEAIGSGNFQPIDEVREVVAQIKRVFGAVPIIYGGSVSAANVKEYLAVVDGVLVGTHSLKAAEFSQLLTAAL